MANDLVVARTLPVPLTMLGNIWHARPHGRGNGCVTKSGSPIKLESVLCKSQSSRQARRANATECDEAPFAIGEHPVLLLFACGTKPGVDCGDRYVAERGHQLCGLRDKIHER